MRRISSGINNVLFDLKSKYLIIPTVASCLQTFPQPPFVGTGLLIFLFYLFVFSIISGLCDAGLGPGRAMEDPWGAAVIGFQVWVAVLLGLVMLPAMFGLSLGVTGVYIQILVRILEVGRPKFVPSNFYLKVTLL